MAILQRPLFPGTEAVSFNFLHAANGQSQQVKGLIACFQYRLRNPLPPPPRAPFAARAFQLMAKSTQKRRSVVGVAKRLAAGPCSPPSVPQPFQHPIFTSEAEYDQSVASVVARIRSGAVKARTPDA